MAAFPGGTHSKERCNQVSLVEELQDSDAEEETAGTAGELLFSLVTDSSDTLTSPDAGINITSLTSHIIERIWTGPPNLSEPMVMPPHIQQQMSPSVFFPPWVPVAPSTGSRQELLPPTKSGSFPARSGMTLSETAEAYIRAMNSPLNGDENYYPSGGFWDSLAKPLSQESWREFFFWILFVLLCLLTLYNTSAVTLH